MIDVVINSASRPDCLKITVQDMLENFLDLDDYRITLHEDVVKKAESTRLLNWAVDSGLFWKILVKEPAERLGPAVFNCLKQVESDLVVKWEDDWGFLQKVSCKTLVQVMTENVGINQIAFNKYPNEPTKHNFIRPVYVFNGLPFTLLQEWCLGPGIWRTDFVRKRWEPFEDAHQNVPKFPTMDQFDAAGLVYNLGAYFYGGHGEGPFLKHLGLVSMWFAGVEK